MSYCRFRPDSDLHCYYNGGHGSYAVCVAGVRIIRSENEAEGGDEIDHLLSQRREIIDLPYAGSSRNFGELEWAYQWILELVELGYLVRQEDLAAIKDEVERIKRLRPRGVLLDIGSPDWASDLAVYELPDGEGYELKVAEKRAPEGVDLDALSIIELMELEYDKIDLPNAGSKFTFASLDEVEHKAVELREQGFVVTEAFFDNLDEHK